MAGGIPGAKWWRQRRSLFKRALPGGWECPAASQTQEGPFSIHDTWRKTSPSLSRRPARALAWLLLRELEKPNFGLIALAEAGQAGTKRGELTRQV